MLFLSDAASTSGYHSLDGSRQVSWSLFQEASSRGGGGLSPKTQRRPFLLEGIVNGLGEGLRKETARRMVGGVLRGAVGVK